MFLRRWPTNDMSTYLAPAMDLQQPRSPRSGEKGDVAYITSSTLQPRRIGFKCKPSSSSRPRLAATATTSEPAVTGPGCSRRKRFHTAHVRLPRPPCVGAAAHGPGREVVATWPTQATATPDENGVAHAEAGHVGKRGG